MNRTFINNSRFMECVTDLTSQVVEERFGEDGIADTNADTITYTEEAQDFFNRKYDEIENMINVTMGVYSNNDM